jgi:hypothetical protein
MNDEAEATRHGRVLMSNWFHILTIAREARD